MLTSLLLSSLAFATTDIGTEKMFGIGVSAGSSTYANFNGKVWFGEESGLSFHAGTLFVYHELGAQYEGGIYRGEWLDFADIPFYWFAGVDIGMYTGYGTIYPQIGVAGGAGAAMQFKSVPAEVFVEPIGVDVYPVNWCSAYYSSFNFSYGCGLGFRATAGGRWYF